MTQKQEKFCFCTLALGKRYRLLALELAKDLEKYAPNATFLVLTDNLQDFKEAKNVLALKHQQKLWCDNDKSFLIEEALSLFDYCICIDADMRVLAPVSSDLKWLPCPSNSHPEWIKGISLVLPTKWLLCQATTTLRTR